MPKIVIPQAEEGGTLSEIALKYNTTIDELLTLNPTITDPNLIIAGEALNVPGEEKEGVVPTGGEVTTISTKDVREDAEADKEKLRGLIASTESQIALLEKIKVEKEEEKEIIPEEEIIEEEEEEEESPEVTQLKTQIEDYEIQLDDFISSIDALRTKVTEATDSLIQSIEQQFEQRRVQMRDINKRALESLRTFGIRMGTARYAPLVATGIVSAEERAGIARLAELDAEEARLIAEAQIAADKNDFIMLHAKMELIDSRRAEKVAELQKLQDAVLEKNKEIEEQERRVTVQAAIMDLLSQGITDPVDIFSLANFDEEGNLIGDVDINEITDILDVIAEDEDEEFGTGAVGQFNQLKAFGEIPEEMGFFEYLTLEAAVKRAPAEEKLLTVSEAEKLQLPYGTTRAEAAAMGKIPSAKVTREDLTPFQRLSAMKMAVKIWGKRAGSKPENYGLIMDLLAGGMSIDDIGDQLRYIEQSEEFAGVIRDAAESIAVNMTAANRDFFMNSLDRSLEDGDMDRVRELMISTTISTYGPTESKVIRGSWRALKLVNEIEVDLRAYEAKGGETGIFTGTMEEIAEKAGRITDVELATLNNKIRMAIQRYRHDISGAAFTESEAKEYRRVFPSIGRTQDFNTANITSIRAVFSGDVRFYVEGRIGSKPYEEIFGSKDLFAGQTAYEGLPREEPETDNFPDEYQKKLDNAEQYLKDHGLIP